MRPTPFLVLGIGVLLAGTVLVGLAGAGVLVDDQRAGFVQTTEENRSMPIPPADFESTERLVLVGEEAAEAEATIGLDPSVATGTSFARMNTHFRAYRLEAEMDAANGSEAELAAVDAALADIEAEIAADLEQERRAHVAVATGERDGDALLRELSVLHIRSTIIEEELDRLADALRDVTAPVTQDEAQRLRGEASQAQLEARTLQGPVTDRGAALLRGERTDADPVLLRATETGYILTTIEEGVFARQALASENRQRGSGAGFADIDEARTLTAELYPWTVAESLESEDIPRGEIYSSTIDHPHGTTAVYIDGATERPFRDGHELDLFSMATVTAHDDTHDDVRVLIDRTYPGGPIQVGVYGAAENDPIRGAEIEVDGTPQGATDYDGTRWFIAPDASFELVVDTPAGEVTVPVELPA